MTTKKNYSISCDLVGETKQFNFNIEKDWSFTSWRLNSWYNTIDDNDDIYFDINQLNLEESEVLEIIQDYMPVSPIDKYLNYKLWTYQFFWDGSIRTLEKSVGAWLFKVVDTFDTLQDVFNYIN